LDRSDAGTRRFGGFSWHVCWLLPAVQRVVIWHDWLCRGGLITFGSSMPSAILFVRSHVVYCVLPPAFPRIQTEPTRGCLGDKSNPAEGGRSCAVYMHLLAVCWLCKPFVFSMALLGHCPPVRPSCPHCLITRRTGIISARVGTCSLLRFLARSSSVGIPNSHVEM